MQVLRYLCKRCGHALRVYPVGVGPARQSAATREIILLFARLGISPHAIAGLLAGLGCPFSPSGVRNNLRRAGLADDLGIRLQLVRDGPTSFSGPDGALSVRLAGSSPLERWLEVEVEPGPHASALLTRLRMAIDSHRELRDRTPSD